MAENPRPKTEVFFGGGAIGGSLFPLFFWGLWRWARLPEAYLFRFWAGFYLVVNGAYFGGDFSVRGPTDAGQLVEWGTPRWTLVTFGVAIRHDQTVTP